MAYGGGGREGVRLEKTYGIYTDQEFQTSGLNSKESEHLLSQTIAKHNSLT